MAGGKIASSHIFNVGKAKQHFLLRPFGATEMLNLTLNLLNMLLFFFFNHVGALIFQKLLVA